MRSSKTFWCGRSDSSWANSFQVSRVRREVEHSASRGRCPVRRASVRRRVRLMPAAVGERPLVVGHLGPVGLGVPEHNDPAGRVDAHSVSFAEFAVGARARSAATLRSGGADRRQPIRSVAQRLGDDGDHHRGRRYRDQADELEQLLVAAGGLGSRTGMTGVSQSAHPVPAPGVALDLPLNRPVPGPGDQPDLVLDLPGGAARRPISRLRHSSAPPGRPSGRYQPPLCW